MVSGILDESGSEVMFKQKHLVTWHLQTGREVSQKWSGSSLVARSALGYTSYRDRPLSINFPGKREAGSCRSPRP